MKRYLLGSVAIAAVFAGSLAFAAPASAAAPVGGCPPGFKLFPVSQLPPGSGTPSFDHNGDGSTCLKLIAEDPKTSGSFDRFVAVDNLSSVP
jgi:hypothetical protein